MLELSVEVSVHRCISRGAAAAPNADFLGYRLLPIPSAQPRPAGTLRSLPAPPPPPRAPLHSNSAKARRPPHCHHSLLRSDCPLPSSRSKPGRSHRPLAAAAVRRCRSPSPCGALARLGRARAPLGRRRHLRARPGQAGRGQDAHRQLRGAGESWSMRPLALFSYVAFLRSPAPTCITPPHVQADVSSGPVGLVAASACSAVAAAAPADQLLPAPAWSIGVFDCCNALHPHVQATAEVVPFHLVTYAQVTSGCCWLARQQL